MSLRDLVEEEGMRFLLVHSPTAVFDDDLLKPLTQSGDDLWMLLEQVGLLVRIVLKIEKLPNRDLSDLIPAGLVGRPSRSNSLMSAGAFRAKDQLPPIITNREYSGIRLEYQMISGDTVFTKPGCSHREAICW